RNYKLRKDILIMDKKVLSLSTTKLGDFTAKAKETNIEIPNEIMVIRAQPRYEYVDGVQTDSVSKIAIQAIDVKAVEAAKAVDIEITEMPTFSVEIIDKNIVTEHLSTINELENKVYTTENAQIKLKWTSRGWTGGWGELKLILSNLNPMKGANKNA